MKHFIFLFLFALFGLILNTKANPPGDDSFSGGDGSVANPYQIATLSDLEMLSNSSEYWDSCFVQTADIDALATATWNDGAGFTPIGYKTSSSDYTYFTGTYNGKGHTIRNLYINRPDLSRCGLFGVTAGATIDSINVMDANISGSKHIGVIVGQTSNTKITNCYSSGSISALNGYIGGLIGYATTSTINYCYSTVNVTSESNYNGGLIGYNKNKIDNCYATGNVVASGKYTGGFVGGNNGGSINTSYATGNVSATTYTGGFVGKNMNSGIISECYSVGAITGGTSYTGAFAGQNTSSTINRCYWNSDLSGISSAIGSGSGDIDEIELDSLKYSNSYSNWDIANNAAWNITEGKSYPALDSVANNAPFGVPEQIIADDATVTISIDTISANDYDYEKGATSVFFTILNTTSHIGSISNDVYSFYTNVAKGSVDTITYRVGEVVTEGDTLWGNEVNCLLMIKPFENGSGTEDDPFQIASLADLKTLSNLSGYWDKHYIQTNDIDATETAEWNNGAGFSPIGTKGQVFSGSFNGKGHTISGIYINQVSEKYMGLWGYLNNATIDSVSLKSTTVSAYMYSGALAGYVSASTITNCSSQLIASKSLMYSGGLIGSFKGSTLNSCFSTGVMNDSIFTGGLIGFANNAEIYNSYSTCTVNSIKYSGGFIGKSNQSVLISNCYCTGNVTSRNYAGGFAGYNYSSGTISSCYSAGDIDITTEETIFGGFCGKNNEGTIENCFWNKEVTQIDFSASNDGDLASIGLTTDSMKMAVNFDGWDITSSATWSISEGKTYPSLDSVRNNAPFAFADSIAVSSSGSLDLVLENDYDYETGQTKQTYKIIDATQNSGILNETTYTFNANAAVGDADTITYIIGEVIAEGDTLWGNQAMATIYYKTPTAVNNLSDNNRTFTVYPNPAVCNEPFSLEIGGLTNAGLNNAVIYIYNITGVIVEELTTVKNNNTVELPSGIYIAVLREADGSQYCQKIIVQ